MIIVVYGPAPAHMNTTATRGAQRAVVSHALVLSVAMCAVCALGHDLDAWPAAIAETHAGTPTRQLTDSIDNFAASATRLGAIANVLQADTPALDAAFDAAGQTLAAIVAGLAPLAARSAGVVDQLAGVADDCAADIDHAFTRSAAAQAEATISAPSDAAAEHSAAASSRRHAAL